MPPKPMNLPESELADVREYIYIDRPRVGSLLAQFAGGLATERTESRVRTKQLGIGFKALSGARTTSENDEERLALDDLLVSRLEEDATALGYLADLSEKAAKPKFWKRGQVRDSLQPSQLIRVTAWTQLLDVRPLLESLRSFDELSEDDDDEFDDMLKMAEALYGDDVALSIRPTIDADPECAFTGVIPPEAAGALQRSTLPSRMSPDGSDLTTLFQVARVPSQRDSAAPAMSRLDDIAQQIMRASEERLDRNLFDQFLSVIGAAIEDFGLRAAPRWPAISVTPLAIYRTIPPAPEDANDGEEDEVEARQ